MFLQQSMRSRPSTPPAALRFPPRRTSLEAWRDSPANGRPTSHVVRERLASPLPLPAARPAPTTRGTFGTLMRNPATVLFVATTFVLSGLLISLFLLAVLIFVRPFSLRLHRIIVAKAHGLYCQELMFLVHWWAGIEIRLFCADQQTVDSLGRDKGLVIANHRCSIDFILTAGLSDQFGLLGTCKGIGKWTGILLPGLGSMLWFCENVFLSRNWQRDQGPLIDSCDRLSDYPLPFWFLMWPEGTRFSERKCRDSQNWAEQNNKPVLKNVLYPRLKGTKLVMSRIRNGVDCIYDLTGAFPDPENPPGLHNLIHGTPARADFWLRRIPTSEIPEDEEGVANLCVELFEEKDELLEQYKETRSFPDTIQVPIKPRLFSLLVELVVLALTFSGCAYYIVPGLLAGSAFHWQLAGAGTLLGLVSCAAAYGVAKHTTYGIRNHGAE